jgi:flavin reductase (DIM6/NTAB) family NADH-FMN oxidoreductase RutF
LAKVKKQPFTALYPVPAVMVSCADGAGGRPNIITLAWVGTLCSEPPIIGIGIRPHRYSHGLIKKSREFVINIPSADQVKALDYCGIYSGRDVDKFKATGLTPQRSQMVTPPGISECPVNIECKVKDIISLGSHDLFLGEVVLVQVDEEILTGRGRIDYIKAAPIAYNIPEYWGIGELLGLHGLSRRSGDQL